MSELPDMISAVVQDDKVDAESHFKNTMAQKIGSVSYTHLTLPPLYSV